MTCEVTEELKLPEDIQELYDTYVARLGKLSYAWNQYEDGEDPCGWRLDGILEGTSILLEDLEELRQLTLENYDLSAEQFIRFSKILSEEQASLEASFVALKRIPQPCCLWRIFRILQKSGRSLFSALSPSQCPKNVSASAAPPTQ